MAIVRREMMAHVGVSMLALQEEVNRAKEIGLVKVVKTRILLGVMSATDVKNQKPMTEEPEVHRSVEVFEKTIDREMADMVGKEEEAASQAGVDQCEVLETDLQAEIVNGRIKNQ